MKTLISIAKAIVKILKSIGQYRDIEQSLQDEPQSLEESLDFRENIPIKVRGEDGSFLDWEEKFIEENKRVLSASVGPRSLFLSSLVVCDRNLRICLKL